MIRFSAAMLLASVCLSAQAGLVNFVESTDLPDLVGDITDTFLLDTPGVNQWTGTISEYATVPAPSVTDFDDFKVELAPGISITDVEFSTSNVTSSGYASFAQVLNLLVPGTFVKEYSESRDVLPTGPAFNVIDNLPAETGMFIVQTGPSAAFCSPGPCTATWTWTISITTSSATKEVDIDVKPGSDPNCFNANGHGVIPVGILGGETFDVLDIETSSLHFAGLEVRVRGNKGPLCNGEFVDGDGYLDLVCQFEDDASLWSPDSDSDATLEGMLSDGTEFVGTDSICIVP